MQKKLLKIPKDKFDFICAQFSITTGSRTGKVIALSNYLKMYGLTYEDLASRFQLDK